MSDGLVPPLNAPPGVQLPPGVQPGVSQPVVIANLVIIFGPSGKISGLFEYAPGTVPRLGNPPISWITPASADPYGNAVTPGIFLAEMSGSGNAKIGFMWNTVVGSQPLLAVFPDTTLPFTGNSPFILARVLNRGLASESVSLALGGGSAFGTAAAMLELFGISADGTTVTPNILAYVPLQVTPDGTVYKTGHKTFSASNVNVTSTVPVNALSIPLAAGFGYHITGQAIYHGNQAAGVPSFSWAGSGGLVLGGQQNGYQTYVMSGGGTHINNGALGAANGPTLLNGGEQIYNWEIYVSVTTGGTLNITAAEGTATDSFVIDTIYATVELF